MTRRAGFTLLELLMVVIIIAILAAIALPQYVRVVARSRGAQALSFTGAVRSAEIRFRAENGNYNGLLAGLDIDIIPPTGWDGGGPLFTVVNVAAPGVDTGAIELAEDVSGLTLGNMYGSGTVCGTYVDFDPALALCGAGD